MLSKEEIESRKQLTELLKRAINTKDDLVTLKLDKIACKTLYNYINEQETDKQKLIEKLEELEKELKMDGYTGYASDVKEILEIAKGEK